MYFGSQFYRAFGRDRAPSVGLRNEEYDVLWELCNLKPLVGAGAVPRPAPGSQVCASGCGCTGSGFWEGVTLGAADGGTCSVIDLCVSGLTSCCTHSLFVFVLVCSYAPPIFGLVGALPPGLSKFVAITRLSVLEFSVF